MHAHCTHTAEHVESTAEVLEELTQFANDVTNDIFRGNFVEEEERQDAAAIGTEVPEEATLSTSSASSETVECHDENVKTKIKNEEMPANVTTENVKKNDDSDTSGEVAKEDEKEIQKN